MKEAIANANVFNLVIVFVIILIAFFVGSLSYSKAFKVKNMIVNEIEKEQEYNINVVQTNVEKSLSGIGYRTKSSVNNNCPDEGGELVSSSSNYEYCVYKFEKNSGSKKSIYYRVVAYMYFDIPIISSLLKVPVKGETISFTEINS